MYHGRRVDNYVDNSPRGRSGTPNRRLFFVHPRCSMLHKVHELHDVLERQRVMLSFKGPLSPDLVTALLAVAERKLVLIESDQRTRKRVFNVLVECLQNLYHHNVRPQQGTEEGRPSDGPTGVVMIACLDDGYQVLTGNFMAGADVDRLKDLLDRINALPPDALRDFYRQRLADGTYTKSGGGGLGMIDMARKSGAKLEYGFVPYDKDSAFFSLNVNVTT